jgi:hypothetical protein
MPIKDKAKDDEEIHPIVKMLMEKNGRTREEAEEAFRVFW